MELSCIIIDDEPGGRKVIEEYIAETPFLRLAGKAEDPMQALPLLTANDVHLIFLDIQMPKINGIDFLKSLKNPPMVIITTAFSEYALQGFELDVIDYLLKPVSLERFLRAAQKALDYHSLQGRSEKSGDYFFVKSNNRYERVNFDEVLFVEAANNYIIIHTPDRKLIAYLTFKGVEDILPTADFIKVHKSFIVSLSKIQNLDSEEIRIGKHVIPISRSLKESVMNKVVNRNLIRR